MARSLMRSLLTATLLIGSATLATAGEVKGRVTMPDACSPSISPAVVTLDPVDGAAGPAPADAEPAVALVRQQGLQFEPRVQVARVGRPIQFTNQDGETHNVHSATSGVTFSWSMAPNATQSYTPDQTGLIRLVCDVHSHMRGYVVVTASPWAKVCKSNAGFRFKDVPAGRYVLNIWHEMGPAHRAEVTVGDAGQDLGTIALQGAAPARSTAQAAAPVVAWPEVIDRISLLLGEARILAPRPGGFAKARKLAEDAYWGEFEMSDMENAVRQHLGYDRAGVIEGHLRGFRTAIKAVSEKQADAADLRDRLGLVLLELSRAATDLKRLNVCDRRDVGKGSAAAVATPAAPAETIGTPELTEKLAALAASFRQIQQLADSGQADDAASLMSDAYVLNFDPLERMLNARAPHTVSPLEARFNALRGQIGAGSVGPELAGNLDQLRSAVTAAVDEASTAPMGSFKLAFSESLFLILREGVEVILLLTMLIALAVKAGQPRALAAIWWGVGAAVAASGATAYGLHSLLAASRGRTGEIMEGAVMMLAAAVLFYVSYWLISQTQAKRWTDFLKQQAAHGAKVGGLGTLALTSFLAVYREGAETALLYQALLSAQDGARDGLAGLAAGLLVGLILLAVIALAIKASSLRLPIRSFFKGTGFLLFAMAVIFAGNGVFELQNAGMIKVTPVSWVGSGIPALGLHPNLQTIVIQGFLVLGAVLTLLVPIFDKPVKPRPASLQSNPARVSLGV